MKEKIIVHHMSTSFCCSEVGTDDRVYIKHEQNNNEQVRRLSC